MSFVIVFLSVILAWFFIEITLLIAIRNNDYANNSKLIDRIYISFQDVPASLWAWNGRTFG